MTVFSKNATKWLEKILEERFGHHFLVTASYDYLTLRLDNKDGAIYFDSLSPEFHESHSDHPCGYWPPTEEGFSPVLAKMLPTPAIETPATPLVENDRAGNIVVHYDILGLTYWMLTRLEEIGCSELDEHARFPATSSHAYKNNYLERPIVDEWLHILGQVIQLQWPRIKLKEHQFEMKVSHDVDAPARYAFQSPKGIVRAIGGDIIRRRDFRSTILGPWIWLNSRSRIHPKDPVNTFDWLMRQSEDNGLTSAFYFICGRTNPKRDAQYEPESPQIRQLMHEIHQRGHEIGLHPSYNTYRAPHLIQQEADRLRQVCKQEGIEQTQWGGRMHFLRWDQATTLKAWDDAGMDYDSTLGYADHPGFRCGTCFEYPAFDATGDRALNLRVRPLIAMDCTVMADRYMGLGSTDDAFHAFNQLKNTCRAVKGTFTLLWHNSYFQASKDFDIYRCLLNS